MQHLINRRDFLNKTSIVTAGLAATLATIRPACATKGPNEKVLIGIIGCNDRGKAHIAGYLALPNAEIAYICDVDSRALQKGIDLVAAKQEHKPQGVKDFRRVLDDPAIDAVSIAVPDH